MGRGAGPACPPRAPAPGSSPSRTWAGPTEDAWPSLYVEGAVGGLLATAAALPTPVPPPPRRPEVEGRRDPRKPGAPGASLSRLRPLPPGSRRGAKDGAAWRPGARRGAGGSGGRGGGAARGSAGERAGGRRAERGPPAREPRAGPRADRWAQPGGGSVPERSSRLEDGGGRSARTAAAGKRGARGRAGPGPGPGPGARDSVRSGRRGQLRTSRHPVRPATPCAPLSPESRPRCARPRAASLRSGQSWRNLEPAERVRVGLLAAPSHRRALAGTCLCPQRPCTALRPRPKPRAAAPCAPAPAAAVLTR